MNAIQEIMNKLDEIFAEMDAKVLESSKKMGFGTSSRSI